MLFAINASRYRQIEDTDVSAVARCERTTRKHFRSHPLVSALVSGSKLHADTHVLSSDVLSSCRQASCRQASCRQASCRQTSCRQASCRQTSCRQTSDRERVDVLWFRGPELAALLSSAHERSSSFEKQDPMTPVFEDVRVSRRNVYVRDFAFTTSDLGVNEDKDHLLQMDFLRE
ncbi:hypothetical protein F2P81_023012 [Scophthalmus maximus]|uniref:Uncharacterized protein n=1 Tax=Scophthalmus maximus TaxID=52904 RepID=A0A6A4RXZ9_SCOMX|nr:hypothetical protein F2P81_023012 [Scophthalmus maximus]